MNKQGDKCNTQKGEIFSEWSWRIFQPDSDYGTLTKKGSKTAVYTADVISSDEIKIYASFKFPTKNKYNGIVIRESGDQTILFTGIGIKLTGDLELDGEKVNSTNLKGRKISSHFR